MNSRDVKAISIPECVVANTSQTFSSTTNTGSNALFNYYPTSTSALGSCKAIRIKGKFHVYGNSYSWLGVWYNSDALGGETQLTLNTGSGWVDTPFDITCYLVNDTWINNTLWGVFAFGGGSSNYRWIRAVVAKTNNNNLDFYTQSDTTNEYFRVTIDSIEVGVSKITDSNNVVLWGSDDAFPYRRLEYIESTDNSSKGTYCIQFDFYCTINSTNQNHLDIDFQLTDTTFSRQGQYWGGIASMKDIDCRIGYVDTNSKKIVTYILGSGTQANITSRMWNLDKHTLSVYRNKCYVDGVDCGACSTGNTGNNNNISLFAQKYDNSEWSILGRFYKLRVYTTSGTIYHEVFPCQRKSDGVIGVYNTKNNKFYTNSGTGTFTAGPVVDEYWDLTAPS